MQTNEVFLIIFCFFLLYFILDLRRIIRIKSVTVLPENENISLSPEGLIKIYEYFRDPSLIPSEIKLTEDYILEEIRDIIKYINSRYDCSEFWSQLLFRLYKDFGDKIPRNVKKAIKECFLGFKYYLDEPGDDSMCFLTENHFILFATLEYLVGQEWANEKFINSGLSGKEHSDKAKTRLLSWFDQKYKFGFFEWYSNFYFLEDLAPLSQLIEYAIEPTIKSLAIDTFHLMMFEVASHTVENRFCCVSSRLYSENKGSNRFGNKIQPIMNALFEENFDFNPISQVKLESPVNRIVVNLQMCAFNMIKKGFYKIPKVIKEIAHDSNDQIIKSSNGLKLSEYKPLGLIGPEIYQIIAQFSNIIMVNPGFCWNTFKYYKKNKMFTNIYASLFKFADLGIIRLTRLLPLISKILDKNFMPTGIALSRGNVYTYRTKNYMLSTAVNCHVDYNGTQQHISLANLSEDLNVFTQYPSSSNYSGSPGYWIGNRRKPMSVQDKSINLTIFRMGKGRRLGEFANPMYGKINLTHTLFPKDRFDEIKLEDTYAFGRIGEKFISIICNHHFEYKAYNKESAIALLYHFDYRLKSEDNLPLPEDIEKYIYSDLFDLCVKGELKTKSKQKKKDNRYHMYVTELSDIRKESFKSFMTRIKANHFKGETNFLEYHSNDKKYHLEYSGVFHINGINQNLEFPRFESEYCFAERMQEQFTIKYNGESLYLNNRSN